MKTETETERRGGRGHREIKTHPSPQDEWIFARSTRMAQHEVRDLLRVFVKSLWPLSAHALCLPLCECVCVCAQCV